MRSPHLYDTLRRFCLGAFAVFHGEDLPFAFDEHAPSFYEYRPLVKGFIEGQAERLRSRADVQEALDDLAREPLARVYKDAYRTVLVPLLVRVAEGCGGFDWDDVAFDRAYEEAEALLFGNGHAYGAIAPLVGLSCGSRHRARPGDARAPERDRRVRGALARVVGTVAARFRPRGRPRRACSSSSDSWNPEQRTRRTRPASSPTPSPPSVSPPRRPSRPAPCCSSASTGGRSASGPCSRSRRRRLPARRRGSIRSARQVAAKLIPQLALADADAHFGDALDRWELSLFQDDPFRGEQLRHAVDAALGEGDGRWAAAMRAAALLGETAEERSELADSFRTPTPDLVRRMLVAMLLHGDRAQLLRELDHALLGLQAGRARVAELRAS